jgi:hypothetical protein
MNHHISVNEAIDTSDGISILPSKLQEKDLNELESSDFFRYSGVDVPHGCMPNRFSHILFGQLKGLSDNATFAGDRIYIKPEPFGLQQFRHYLARKCTRDVSSRGSHIPSSIVRHWSLHQSGLAFVSLSIH